MPCLSMIWRKRKILQWMWKMWSRTPWRACCISFTQVADVAPFLLLLCNWDPNFCEVSKTRICSGKLDFLEFASMELASHLLAAADKYALPRLKVLTQIQYPYLLPRFIWAKHLVSGCLRRMSFYKAHCRECLWGTAAQISCLPIPIDLEAHLCKL